MMVKPFARGGIVKPNEMPLVGEVPSESTVSKEFMDYLKKNNPKAYKNALLLRQTINKKD